MAAQNIVTDRLIIIPMTYSVMCSVLNGDTEELKNSGINMNEKWPRKDTYDILHFLKDKMQKSDTDSWFDIWMVVKKEGMTVIGDAGFKGKPDENGMIEIGFGLIEEEQGKGYGLEVASSLMEWAGKQRNVKTIIADCLLNNYASIKVLKKCGMNEVRRDGELIYWEKRLY